MTIAQEEIFGPVLSVLRYGDEDEAVASPTARATAWPAAVWGSGATRSRSRSASAAGTVWVNEYHLLNPHYPFGGYKQCGIGREHGYLGTPGVHRAQAHARGHRHQPRQQALVRHDRPAGPSPVTIHRRRASFPLGPVNEKRAGTMRGLRTVALVATLLALTSVAAAPSAGADARAGEQWLAQQRARAPRDAATAWWGPSGSGAHSARAAAAATAARPAPIRDRAAWRAAFIEAGGPAAPARALAARYEAAGVAFAQGGAYPPGQGLAQFDRVIDAGDLDGDGGRDALVAGRVLSEDRFAVRAVSGRDGHELWAETSVSANIPTLIPLAPAGGDVLDVSFIDQGVHYEGDCDAAGCSEFRDHTFLWAIRLLAGTTGAVRWELLLPGTQRDSFAYSQDLEGSQDENTFERVDRDVVVLPAGDLDGDGSGDFIVQRGSVREEYRSEYVNGSPGVPGTSSNHASVRATIVVETLSGVDGTVLARYEVADVAATATPSAGVDVDGDGRPEVVLAHQSRPDRSSSCGPAGCREQRGPETVALEVLDGSTLASRWRADVAGLSNGWVDPPRADLAGDGGTDLLVRGSDPSTGFEVLAAVSGRDGTALWRVDTAGYIAAVVAAPIDDDTDADLLLAYFPWDPSSGDLVVVDRRDGATGQLILQSAATAPMPVESCCVYAFAQLSRLGDADGDAVPEFAFGVTTYDYETGAERAFTYLESGRTADPLWTRDGSLSIVPGGDLDGDGSHDGLILHGDRIEAVKLLDATTLWELPSFPWQHTLRRGGDQDGDGDEELLDLAATYDGGYYATELSSLEGRDGSTRWTYPPPGPVAVDRIQGEDRIGTALALSEATFGAAAAAVLARAELYPDALAGGPLAATLRGPLLLTGQDELDPRVATELDRLGVEQVVLLGGEGALGAQVEDDIAALGLAVERLAGGDRYQTAAMVADRMVAAGAAPWQVLLAEGADPDPMRGWPDALSAAAFGAVFRIPVLLTETDVLPPSTSDAITRLGAYDIRVIGGAPAVSQAVLDELTAIGRYPYRIEGTSRFGTARAVADAATANGADPGRVYVATGSAFPDALAASAAVGATGGVLLLVDRTEGAGAADAIGFLSAHRGRLREVHILGGPDVVSTEIEEEIRGVAA